MPEVSPNLTDAQNFADGILPSQEIVAAIERGEILIETPMPADQIQPASVDLRLGAVAYRVRASFLPGSGTTVRNMIDSLTMHEIDLTSGAVLEKGCVYIVQLLESLALPAGTSARANPKSSTGRLDIFTRVITDNSKEFDRIETGYEGPLYAEISPLTFSVLVRTGSRLSQMRLRRGDVSPSDTAMRELHARTPLVFGDAADAKIATANIEGGIAVSVDLSGVGGTDVIGYRAKQHTDIIDVEKIGHYEIEGFWEPIRHRGQNRMILDPDDFYILASKEAVSVPPDYAAEMRAYDTLVGEFRVHYAGFFDPGFGYDVAGSSRSRAVLEVRSHDVPFVLEDGQVVGRLIYESLTATPDQLYGMDIGSNYQAQGLKLSKHFK
ncbi:MAG: 2'-deoxycytidine 5'-triphosphate deaminase [Rhodospirillales bacterium]|jgi:dCTP deaminase|nr:2'-deoxycytidine 5'-triphosphate deaminase [Rhodospirillales bacterium]